MTHQTLMTDQTRSNRLNDKVIGGKQKPSQVVFFLGVGGGGCYQTVEADAEPLQYIARPYTTARRAM